MGKIVVQCKTKDGYLVKSAPPLAFDKHERSVLHKLWKLKPTVGEITGIEWHSKLEYPGIPVKVRRTTKGVLLVTYQNKKTFQYLNDATYKAVPADGNI